MTDYSTMHWKTLQKECEARGMKFDGKDQAIAALTAADAVAAAADVVAPVAEVVASDDDVVAPVAEVVASDDDVAEPTAEQTGAPAFDRSKPYGEVCGAIEEAPGARFFQAGHYFNNAGVKVG